MFFLSEIVLVRYFTFSCFVCLLLFPALSVGLELSFFGLHLFALVSVRFGGLGLLCSGLRLFARVSVPFGGVGVVGLRLGSFCARFRRLRWGRVVMRLVGLVC